MPTALIRPALASVDAISAAIERYYVAGPDEQEELDLALEEHDVTPGPTFRPEAAVSGLSRSAVRQLEDCFENLVRILLDRGVVDVKALDELMCEIKESYTE